MKITFGIINHNRLFYLKSCVKSLTNSLDGIDSELICIDDNSVESGTKEYLDFLSRHGWKVIHQEEKRKMNKSLSSKNNIDHINPFSEALNIIHQESTGDLIVPLQGDMQFIRNDWVREVINLFEQTQDIGTVILDAQRKIRLHQNCAFSLQTLNNIDYFVDLSGVGVNGAGDTVYSRDFLDSLGGWTIGSASNPEDNFTQKALQKFGGSMRKYSLKIPASIAIYTDPRGTNCRIRANKRYGKYWRAQNDLYYKYISSPNYDIPLSRPYSIEEVARANGGWDLPVDELGNWKKSPIDIETSLEGIPIQ